MTTLVIDGRKRADTWRHLSEDEAPAGRDFTVEIARWHEQRRELVAHAERTRCALGIRLSNDGDPIALADDIDRFTLIVIEVPRSADGRVFSIAARIREHLGYRGELRVSGDVAPDQLSFMQRCGINAFELGGHVDVESFLRRYRRFYQSSGPLTTSDNLIRLARRRRADPAGPPPTAPAARPPGAAT